jgi:hypothetical protein
VTSYTKDFSEWFARSKWRVARDILINVARACMDSEKLGALSFLMRAHGTRKMKRLKENVSSIVHECVKYAANMLFLLVALTMAWFFDKHDMLKPRLVNDEYRGLEGMESMQN